MGSNPKSLADWIRGFFQRRRPPARRDAIAFAGATNRRDGGAIDWRLEGEVVGGAVEAVPQ